MFLNFKHLEPRYSYKIVHIEGKNDIIRTLFIKPQISSQIIPLIPYKNRQTYKRRCYEGSAVSTKKELPQFFWKYKNLRYKFHCLSVSILSEMLTVTYLLFVVRVQFCWEEHSFKDFFDGGGKALVFLVKC